MISRNCLFVILLGLGSTVLFSCKKNSTNPDGTSSNSSKHQVTYTVTGTKFTLNFIDSANVFESGVIGSNTWTYTFKQGSGANIGMTIATASNTDVIDSWEITIDGKTYANAFSAGGAYFTVPY